MPNSKWLPRYSHVNIQYKSTVNDNMEGEITYYSFIFNFNLLFIRQICCTEIKFVAVHNKCLKIPNQTSIHSAIHMQRSRFVHLQFIFTSLYMGSRIQNASKQFVLCIQPLFVIFALHPTPQTKI